MGKTAIAAAIADAGMERRDISALYVGNMLSGMPWPTPDAHFTKFAKCTHTIQVCCLTSIYHTGMLSDQQHVGPLLATVAGLSGIEATTVEACCGSGGAALR
jgi:acetyl-CoA acetyltransferase